MKKYEFIFYYLYLIIIFVLFFLLSWGVDDVIPLMLIFFVLKFQQKSKSIYFYALFFMLVTFHAYVLYVDLLDKLGFESIGKFLYSILFFLTGYVFTKRWGEEKASQLILYTAFSMAIFCFLSFLYTVMVYGNYTEFGMNNGRLIYGYFSEKPYSNTLIGGYLAVPMSLLAILFVKENKLNFQNNILVLIFSVSSILMGMALANRSTIFITIIAILLMIFTKKTYFIRVFSIFSIFSILILIYKDKIFLFNRLQSDGGMDNSRYRNWMEGLEIILKSPLGGSNLQTSNGFAHNIWLDIAIPYGVFPMFILILINIIGWYICLRVVVKKNNSSFALIYTVAMVAVSLIFMIEPIYQGLFKLYCFYVFLIGVGIAYLSSEK